MTVAPELLRTLPKALLAELNATAATFEDPERLKRIEAEVATKRATHTPGPWYVEDRVERLVILHEGYDQEIAWVDLQLGDDVEDEQLANATLIGAAPGLMEELERQFNSLSVLRHSLGKNVDPDLLKLVYEMREGARVALAKAGR